MSSFEQIDLRISPDEATDVIRRQLGDLRVVRRDGVIEFRTSTGFVVASLRPRNEPTGAKANLRYRTAPRLPLYLHKMSKGKEIRDALDEYRV
ncbi:hypothetical protein [Haladaptatus caseinilyticus]|uniref:hypothetical protein n=1 Tax=Haladaptatus caseinilyticus TaxID=2993314 RepID=UPI00224AF5B0|nr:hypothetical protein [Haladaptatus caseinilyticus]